MTTLAKIEANQRNGELSTGPRTVEGKVIVSRNATKHGIFAAVPVIPGECPATWESHRAGVVDSLAPVGLLEVNLAERAALLLWRLQRLARYEAESIAASIETLDIPALPPPEEESGFPRTRTLKQKTREEQLQDIRRELRTAREELAEVVPARDSFQSLPEMSSEESVSFAVAESIFETACGHTEAVEELRSDPPAFGSKPFLRKLGLPGADPKNVVWTAELIQRGLNLYATCAQEPPEQLRDAVRIDLEDWAEDCARKVRRLEREATAIARLLDEGSTRKQTSKLLPADGRDERIAKYERHLHNLFTSTLHELERFQARREGEAVPPPVVADINLHIGTGTA